MMDSEHPLQSYLGDTAKDQSDAYINDYLTL